MRARRLRALLVACSLGAAGCEALLTEPAPHDAGVALEFSVATASGGTAEAFAKVNRVYLLFVRPDSATRDTVLALQVRDGVGRARLALRSDERVAALGVYAQLGRGPVPLFEGQRTVRVQVGQPTSLDIPLVAIPAMVRGEPGRIQILRGDTTRVRAAVLFATGDTIAAAAVRWESADPTVAAVTPAGLVLGRAPGTTVLIVRHEALADTVGVDVLARD